MSPKRQDDGVERELNGQVSHTPIAAQVLRMSEDAKADLKGEKKDDEKLSIFWRVFGGTILSIAALVAVTLYNNITSTLTELRNELNRAHEARADLIRKDEFNTRLSNSYERIQAIQQQHAAQTTTLTGLKTELEGMKERLGKSSADVEGSRKENAAANDALKKDLAALEVLRERLALALTDLKSARDDLQKLRHDVDKNQAYDLERRDRRDVQYKQLDETLKEFQKGLQDCREKIARLEGQYGPPNPMPKKASNPRPPAPEPAKKPEGSGN